MYDMTKRRTLARLIFAGPLAGGLASACASGPEAALVPVGDARIEVRAAGAGQPTVVFIHGLGDDMDTWSEVLPAVAARTTVLAYNRPGYGRSGWTDAGRDGVAVSDELHALLAAQGVSGPVVLVGHSLGGAYAQVHARRFPKEVAGLVLVDSVVPGQMELLKRLLPVQAGMAQAAMMTEPPMVAREFRDSGRADTQISGLAPFTGPTIVLAAGRNDALGSAAYSDARRAGMQALAQEAGGELRATDTGHFIQRESPDTVVRAILDVLERNAPE